jgi:hypothetical protein
LPAGDGPDQDGCVVNEAGNAVIIGLGRQAAESALRLPVEVIGIGYLGDAAHAYLSHQVKYVACVAGGQPVKVEMSEFLCLPGLGRGKVAGLVATLNKRVAKQRLLLRSWLQFDVGDQLHDFKNR